MAYLSSCSESCGGYLYKLKPHSLDGKLCGCLWKLGVFRMFLVGFSKGFQFYDPGLVAYSPGDDLFGVFPIIRFDDGPATMSTVMTAPFKVMQIAGCMDFLDNGVTVAGLVG